MAQDKERVILSDPNLLRPEVACVIGHIAIHWTRLEDFITYFIQALLSLQDESAAVIYSETSSLQKANIVKGLITLTGDAELIEECDTLLLEYNRLRTMRNDILHGLWAPDGDNYIVYRVVSQGYARIKPAVFTMQKLREAFTAILNLIALLNIFSGKLTAKEVSKIIARPSEKPFQAPPPSRRSQNLDQARLDKKQKRQNHAARPAQTSPSAVDTGE